MLHAKKYGNKKCKYLIEVSLRSLLNAFFILTATL